MPEARIIHADCLNALRDLPDESVHAVITDPPYGLANTDAPHVVETLGRWFAGERDYLPSGAGFMGKAWDAFVPPPAVWDECLRVLKPGGHLLAFAGTRTVDLMGLAVRLAGFDLRDTITWIYGSGFPKSLDVGKAIDKAAGATREVVGRKSYAASYGKDDDRNPRGFGVGNVWRWGDTHLSWDDLPTEAQDYYRAQARKLTDVTAPATPEAQQWHGWGTALKPASEPIVVARKPLAGTVAANVLAHGTGAINVDGCRVSTEDSLEGGTGRGMFLLDGFRTFGELEQAAARGGRCPNGRDAQTTLDRARKAAAINTGTTTTGRWPTNVVLDDEAAAALDADSGITTSSVRKPSGKDERGIPNGNGMVVRRNDTTERGVADSGGASRYFPVFPQESASWLSTSASSTSTTSAPISGATGATAADHAPFMTAKFAPAADGYGVPTDLPVFKYQAKAPTRERPRVDGVAHPTVKPLALMRWLCKLVTPEGGTVLEPFAGSGTTVEAALLEGFDVIGIEREADYLPLIQQRIDRVTTPPVPTQEPLPTPATPVEPPAVDGALW